MLFKKIFCYRWKFNAKLLKILLCSCLYFVAMQMTVFPIILSNKASKTTTKKQGSIIEPSLDNTTKEIEETEEQIQYILEGRSKKLQNMCQARPRPEETITQNAFFIDNDYNLLWCSVFKAASSLWLHKLLILGGKGNATFNRKHNLINAVRQLYPSPSQLELSKALQKPAVTSLIIVRDPLVRILSAYRDKLERRFFPHYTKISRYIVSHYRNKSDISNTMPKVWPTFEEFVNFLVDPKNGVKYFDEHWIPYSKYCTPCTVQYTTIAKVETLDMDMKFIDKKLGIDKVLNRQPPNTFIKNKSKDGKKTTNLVKQYFGQLNFDTLEKLIKVYEDDFDLFGYDKKPYYSYVKNKS